MSYWIVDRSRVIACGSDIELHEYSVHCENCEYQWEYTTSIRGKMPGKYCPNCGKPMISKFVFETEKEMMAPLPDQLKSIADWYQMSGSDREAMELASDICERVIDMQDIFIRR